MNSLVQCSIEIYEDITVEGLLYLEFYSRLVLFPTYIEFERSLAKTKLSMCPEHYKTLKDVSSSFLIIGLY